MTVNRPSNIDITQIKKPYIVAGSKEDFYLSETAAIRVAGSTASNSNGASVVGSGTSGAGDGSGSGGSGNPSTFDRPQLADITAVTKSVYYDYQQQKLRAKLIISIKNTSGKNLLGMDARISIPQGSGGQ